MCPALAACTLDLMGLGIGLDPNTVYGRHTFTLFEHFIAYSGAENIIPLLVSAGAHLDGTFRDGYPLRLSILLSEGKMTAALVAAGADLELAIRHSNYTQQKALYTFIKK